MTHSQLVIPSSPSPDLTTKLDDGFTWSDVELCLAALPACLEQYGFQVPEELIPDLVTLAPLLDFNLGTNHPTHHQHSFGSGSGPEPVVNLSPSLKRHPIDPLSPHTKKSAGHYPVPHRDSLLIASMVTNAGNYVRRPMPTPPSAFQVLQEWEAKPEPDHTSVEAMERYRKRKWVAHRDTWPSFTLVMVDGKLLPGRARLN